MPSVESTENQPASQSAAVSESRGEHPAHGHQPAANGNAGPSGSSQQSSSRAFQHAGEHNRLQQADAPQPSRAEHSQQSAGGASYSTEQPNVSKAQQKDRAEAKPARAGTGRDSEEPGSPVQLRQGPVRSRRPTHAGPEPLASFTRVDASE